MSNKLWLQVGVLAFGLVGALVLGVAISKQNRERACGTEGFVPSNHVVSTAHPVKAAGSPVPPMPGFRRVNFYLGGTTP